jgi:hypothetical protein
MTTPVATSTIVAQAFRHMEETPPSSLSDNSRKAAAALEQYGAALHYCLAREDWSFARRLISLPARNLKAGEVADPDLPYQYEPPTDMVRFLRPKDRSVKWRQEQDLIRMDTAGPQLVFYTRKIDNETRLPDTFQGAVSLRLAILLAPTFSITRTKRADLKEDLKEAIFLAKQADATSASAASWSAEGNLSDWVSEVSR